MLFYLEGKDEVVPKGKKGGGKKGEGNALEPI